MYHLYKQENNCHRKKNNSMYSLFTDSTSKVYGEQLTINQQGVATSENIP